MPGEMAPRGTTLTSAAHQTPPSVHVRSHPSSGLAGVSMPDGEAAIGAAAAHAVLTSTVPSSAAAPRRPPRRILSGTDLAAPRAPPAAPPAARTAATAFASTSPAAARSAPDGPLLPANAALLAELHRCAFFACGV